MSYYFITLFIGLGLLFGNNENKNEQIINPDFEECDNCIYAFWDFESNVNNNFLDTVEQRHLTFNGGDFLLAEPKQAIVFDGVNDYLSMNSSLNDFSNMLNNEGCLSFWVKLEEKAATQYLFHAWDSHGNKDLRIEYRNNKNDSKDELVVIFANESNKISMKTSEMPLVFNDGDQQWHHIAITWSRENRMVKAWLDGVAFGEEIYLKNLNWDAAIDEITIGSKASRFPGVVNGYDNFMHGMLDNFRICKKELTDQDVENIYNNDLEDFNNLTLPIELLYFNPECGQENGVDINWSTSSEKNNENFTIFRSLDGNDWEPIADINGAGNSNEVKNYTYHDVEPTVHDTYYKLMQTDFDGKTEEFDIVAIYCKYNHKQITIYPNPASDHIILTFINEHHEEAPLTVLIYSAAGTLIHQQEFFSKSDYNEWRIDLPSKLINGRYFMQAKLGSDYFYTQPFILQK